jgi:NADH-quinone oxidoreductase subunit H
LPRLRMDQLMNFAWKFMLPMTLINIVAAGLWHIMAGGLARWFVCFALILGPYFLLSQTLMSRQSLARRVYRYAD